MKGGGRNHPPEKVMVEKVVYKTSDQPCTRWEVGRADELGHPSARNYFKGFTPSGWEPFAAGNHTGLVYRRCVAVAP